MKPRTIQYYKHYFTDFYRPLDKGTKTKIVYVLEYIKNSERWNQKFVKHIGDGLFEMRVECQSNIYRAFFILDEGNIVMLFNGFQKKSQKTPAKEIEKAKSIMKEYYDEKQRT